MDIEKLVLEYKGKHPYLNVLKKNLQGGETLTFTQKEFAKKLIITNAVKKQDRTLLPLPEIKTFDVDWNKYSTRPPYNFQKLGINWLMNKSHGILGDEMGTGKTTQAIIAATELNLSKVLVICPNTLKLNWKKEIECIDPNAIISVYDKTCNPNAKWIIVNYDKIFKIEKELKALKPKLLIGDEAHLVKSGKKAKRAACFSKIATKCPRVWLLTGTPIANKPIDFYNLLKICKHELGNNKEIYGKKYCGGELTNWGYNYNGASNLKDLHFRTQDIILRRTKKQVLDLPEKQLVPIYLEIKNHKDYLNAANKKYQEIYDNIDNEESEHYGKNLESGASFIEMSAYRMYCALEKIKDGTLFDLIDNILDAGEKVVIFTNFTAVIDAINEAYKEKCVILDGRVSAEQRQKNIESFQNGAPSICACNYKVGSVGTTLTAATYEIMNDYPWDPATLKQAEDRCVSKNQLVLTKRGYIKIQDVKKGDLVYSHLGNWQKVTDTFKKIYSDKLKTVIKYRGTSEKLETTSDHEIYIYDSEEKKYKWEQASRLLPRKHFLVLNYTDLPKSPLTTIKINSFYSNIFFNNFNKKQKNGRQHILPSEIKLSNDFLYMLGRYVGDGWVAIKNNKERGIGICGHIKEKEVIIKLCELIKTTFNISKHSYQETQNCCQFSIGSCNLGYQFKIWCGENSHSKQFPEWVFQLNKEQLENLLQGYYDADGWKKNDLQQATTVSSILASQLIVLNSKLGRNPQFYKTKKHFSIEYSNSINCIIKNNENKVLFPISSVQTYIPKKEEREFYDLTVENDNSFVIGTVSVHNCHRIGQTKKTTIYFPIYNDTIDEIMFNVLKEKTSNLHEAIDGDANLVKFKYNGSVVNEVYKLLKRKK